MKKANYIISFMTCAVGAVFLAAGRSLKSATLDGVTTAASWPNILSWLLIALGLLLAVVTALDGKGAASPINFGSYEFRNILIIIVALAAYVTAYYYLGCLITNAVFFPAFLIYLGERRWKFIAVYDAASLLVIWFLFEKVLRSPLAKAIWM